MLSFILSHIFISSTFHNFFMSSSFLTFKCHFKVNLKLRKEMDVMHWNEKNIILKTSRSMWRLLSNRWALHCVEGDVMMWWCDVAFPSGVLNTTMIMHTPNKDISCIVCGDFIFSPNPNLWPNTCLHYSLSPSFCCVTPQLLDSMPYLHLMNSVIFWWNLIHYNY